MGTLTKYNALVGELEPYTPSALTIQKALADYGITDSTEDYIAASDKSVIAKAAINILKKMIVLSSDSLGKSSQSYNVEMLNKRIQDICSENGLDSSDYVEVSSITDGSNLW
jgi:hypothetical protein